MSSSILEFAVKKKGAKRNTVAAETRRRGRLDRGAINHGHAAAIKTTLTSLTVLSCADLPPEKTDPSWRRGRVGTGKEKIEREEKEVQRVRERERRGPPVRGRGAWDAQIKWEALTRRLLLSMKAEAAPRLMRGEVEPPVGPPRAHSLGDEKAIPVAKQVPALNRTCLI